MSAPWRRFPGGLAARLALVLIALAVLGQVALLAAWLGDRWSGPTADSVRRAVAAATLYDRLGAEDRERLATALDLPGLGLRLTARAPFPPRPGRDVAGGGTAELRAAAIAAGRDVRLRRRGPFVDIAVAVSGGWLSLRAPTLPHGPSLLPRFLLILVLGGGIVAAVAIWAARRVAAPVRRLAEAAERLGTDLGAPPVPEVGPREVRAAAGAFNRMQARLKRYVDDRLGMLAAISHDLRTALTRLRLRVELIDDPQAQAKAVADVEAMQRMLEATLAFARDEAAGEPAVALDLAALAQTACDALADAGAPTRYDGPRSLRFSGRPTALRRAIDNLLSNAATYGGEATLVLVPGDATIELRVGDRGPGITPADRERVFEPFVRLEGSRSQDTGGSGLGLAVARSIARAHGGDVVLEDRLGGGLWAVLRLPRG